MQSKRTSRLRRAPQTRPVACGPELLLDADHKLVISYLVGGRDAVHANTFMQDVAERLATRVQMTTDRDGDEDW